MPPSDSPRGQTIRAQADQGFGRWRQLIGNVTDNLPLNYSPEEVSAEGHPVFYTPTVSPDGATMGGVWDRLGYVQIIGDLDAGHSIEYTWTLPPNDSELPTLLFFNQDGGFGFLGEMTGHESDYQVVTGDTIVLRLESQGDNTWRASINGQQLSPDASNLVRNKEIGQPVFYSRRHGTHTVTTTVNSSEPFFLPGADDGPTKTLSYFQKGLVFTEPFPQTDPENPQEPITIENHVEWSDGSPLTDEEVKWQVAETGTIKSGTGKDILAIWNPIDRILTRADEGEEDEQEVEDFEDLTLSVSARTQVYEEKEEQSLPSFPYVIRQDLDALGAREFRIIGAEVLPEEPFTEEEPFAEFNAEICLIGPDPVDYDVTWVVEIKNPEGEVVVPELQMGEGYQVYAFWDGTVDGESVEEPETYQFHVRVEACESDGGGAAASRAIRSQDTTTPECLGEVAKADFPINYIFEITDLQFGGRQVPGSRDVERTTNGPYLVYDYINDNAPNDQPQWTKKDDAMVPVVMKINSPLFLRTNFQLKQVRNPLGEDKGIQNVKAVRAFVKYKDGPTYPLQTSDVSILNIPGLGFVGNAILPLQVPPGGVGRHQLTIEWQFDLVNSKSETITVKKTTPEEGAHMLYTVFGPQPSETANTGSPPGAAHIWYHPETFRNEVVTSEPGGNGGPTRSPLDLATQWASKGPIANSSPGTPHAKVLERLGSEMYDYGNWQYTAASGQTILSRLGTPESVNLKSILGANRLECPDSSLVLKTFANYLGIKATVHKMEFPNSNKNPLITQYIKVSGDPAKSGYNTNAGIYPPPKSINKYLELSGVQSSEVFIPKSRNSLEVDKQKITRHPSDWFQIFWRYHQVAQVDGFLVDGLVRFSAQNQEPRKTNVDGYLNQLNINDLYRFTVSLVNRPELRSRFPNVREDYIRAYLDGWRQGDTSPQWSFLPPLLLNSRENAGQSLSLSALPTQCLSQEDYKNKLFIGWQDSTYRNATGYNDVLFLNEDDYKSVEILNQ